MTDNDDQDWIARIRAHNAEQGRRLGITPHVEYQRSDMADAARYRWLRFNLEGMKWRDCPAWLEALADGEDKKYVSGADLDRLIDGIR